MTYKISLSLSDCDQCDLKTLKAKSASVLYGLNCTDVCSQSDVVGNGWGDNEYKYMIINFLMCFCSQGEQGTAGRPGLKGSRV